MNAGKYSRQNSTCSSCADATPSHDLPSTNQNKAPLVQRKSGTDSDGDSGIDLSLKRSTLGTENSLTPKLRKYDSALPLTVNYAPLSTPQLLSNCKSQDIPSNQSNSSSQISPGNSSSKTFAKPVDNTDNLKTMPELSPLKEGNTESAAAKTSDLSKSVRFSQTTQVIDTATPRLAELKNLAELSLHSPDLLHDTALEEFDSDSELTGSDSSVDLSGVDPRIAQLALSSQRYFTSGDLDHPSCQLRTQQSSQSISTQLGKKSFYNENNPSDVNTPPKPKTSPVSSNLSNSGKDNVILPSPAENSNAKRPPKPPRVAVAGADVVQSPNQSMETSSLSGVSTEDGADECATPYAVVDVGPFHNQNKPQKAAKNSRSSKPPLPSTQAPSKSQHNSRKSASKSLEKAKQLPSPDNTSEAAANAHQPRKDNSHRSRVMEDSRSKGGDRRSLSESLRREADISSTSSASPRSSTPASVNSSIPTTFSVSPNARTGSSGDLWGSNASLYSDNNLGSSSSLSGSKPSLLGRVGSFKQAAKKKMKSLKRSLSLDRLSSKSKEADLELPSPTPLPHTKSTNKESANNVPAIRKTLSWLSLNNAKFSRKTDHKTKETSNGSKSLSPKKAVVLQQSSKDCDVASPNHFRPIGKLLELCADGCKRVQLNKPPHGPYGLYIGPSPHKSGYFVTRLSDSYAEKMFSGLLAIGDEIKSINGTKASKLSHDDIIEIISKSQKLILKVKSNNTRTSEIWF
ncbi:hypothetical protein EB796_001665 [Bugula neritina]|uniref:PDZ domain-containing protein n=1 Tax=Bugula neritina TaxID=10212 RepID=A0A7J7KPA2_BUGNE|nr:hypothetical protein EB796_001665 [Bugula neritina]